MTLVTLPIILVVLAVGGTTMALAAGGGGSAGGSGAQNAINSGRTLADGQLGPVGSPNHPRSLDAEIPAKAEMPSGEAAKATTH